MFTVGRCRGLWCVVKGLWVVLLFARVGCSGSGVAVCVLSEVVRRAVVCRKRVVERCCCLWAVVGCCCLRVWTVVGCSGL